ncbi:MAG TPA: ABC transporter ATP-binding protein [Bryobacteraceae bacterium]|nr:ABC transporter ATP-binding protein [Bryobacteraceae bacterium]
MPENPSVKARSNTLAQFLRPHRSALFFGFLAVVGESIANLLEPWPLKIVLDSVLKTKHTGGWLNNLIVSVAGTDAHHVLAAASIFVLIIAAFDGACTYAEKYYTTNVGQWVMHDLRKTLYSHIQRMSLGFHDQSQTGDLISRVTSDIDAVQSFITSNLLDTLINSITLLGMVTVMFFVNWRFTLIAISIAPVMFFVVYRYTRAIKKASREVRKKQGEIVSTIQEVLTSIRIVKAFAREEYEQKRLEEQSLENVEIALRARGLKARLTPVVQILTAIGTAMVLWFGGRLALQGALDPGSLVLFIWYLGKMYKPMQDLSKVPDAYSKASVGYERIEEVLQTHRDVQDMPKARPAPRLKGRIEFENVTFSYLGDGPTLSKVSLVIEPGQLAALVGPTGAGKSTIINLIPRFYDPDEGVVKIDGQDIKRYRQKSLREQISFVLQDTVLFHAPIWQNIAYGKPDARRDEILRAAELANVKEFVDKMPAGFDTMVGERGATLSQGQRQRIAIARAIIRDTPILIMDEPTSGLDAVSEKLVCDALDRLMEGRTCIIVAHRLTTIRRADVIFVVKDGAIVERGTHDDLMKQDGLYSELHRVQFETEATPHA